MVAPFRAESVEPIPQPAMKMDQDGATEQGPGSEDGVTSGYILKDSV